MGNAADCAENWLQLHTATLLSVLVWGRINMDFILNKMRPTKTSLAEPLILRRTRYHQEWWRRCPWLWLSSDPHLPLPLPPPPPPPHSPAHSSHRPLPGQRSTTNSATSQTGRPPSSHGDKEQLCEHCEMASDTDTTQEIRAQRKKEKKNNKSDLSCVSDTRHCLGYHGWGCEVF